MSFLLSADFIFKFDFFENKSFRNTIRVSESLDPDQAPRFKVLNYLHMVSADGTCRQRVKRCPPLHTVSLVFIH